MEFQELRYFVRVAEQGSFTQAALRLNMTQPALSKKIRALEVELRTHLFKRNGRGAQLTAEGRRFLDHARGLLQSADAAIRSVRSGAELYEGHVALGLPPSVGRIAIPPLVKAFATRFPKATLSVVEGLSHTLYGQVLSGRLDIAVIRNPAPSPHLSIELLTTEGFYLVGARAIGEPRSSVSLDDLAGLSFILPTAPHSFRQLLEAATMERGPPHIRYEVDAVASLVDLAAAGLGYTLMPESSFCAAGWPPQLSWQKIDSPEMYQTLCFVASARRPEGPLLAEASKVARDLLRHELHLDEPHLALPG